MPRIIHFELPVDSLSRAADFYRSAFGWAIQEWEGGGYWLAMTGGETVGDGDPGIDGALAQRTEPITAPVVTIGVPSVDEYLARVKDAGGEIVAGKGVVPNVGYTGYIRDPEGNIVGLFEDDPNATA